MLRIVVKSMEVEIKKGKSKTGRDYAIPEQQAFMHTDEEVRRIKLTLPQGAQPYPIGEYTLHESSFSVDGYGGLMIDRVRLSPAPAKVAAPSKVA